MSSTIRELTAHVLSGGLDVITLDHPHCGFHLSHIIHLLIYIVYLEALGRGHDQGNSFTPVDETSSILS
jgi:hypothetical protein